MAVLILNQGAMWNRALSITSQPHCYREITAGPTEYKDSWTPESIWTVWGRRETFRASSGARTPCHPARTLIIVKTTLFGSLTYNNTSRYTYQVDGSITGETVQCKCFGKKPYFRNWGTVPAFAWKGCLKLLEDTWGWGEWASLGI